VATRGVIAAIDAGYGSAAMIGNPQFVSLWDLAHQWHDIAVPLESGPLPTAVRTMITSLLEALLDSDLNLYEPIIMREGEESSNGATSLQMHAVKSCPAEFEHMYLSGVYERRILAAYRLDIDDILWWAASNGAKDIPSFCISERWIKSSEPANVSARTRPEVEDKRQCQEVARQKWSQDEGIRIAEMARCREIQVDASGGLYRPATVIGWLREVAPEAVKNRRGRPIKKVVQKI